MAYISRTKVAIIGTGLLLCISAASQVDEIDARLAEAESFYEAGQYTEAANVYENLIAEDYKGSAALYFNLGNAYFESGQLGQALVSYLRAQRLNPRDGDIERNIVRVRANRVLFQRDEHALIDRMSSMTVNSMRITELAGLGFVTWNGFFVLLIIFAVDFCRVRYWRQMLILLGAIACLLNSLLFARLYTDYQRPRAVVTSLVANVYSGPSDEYLRLFDLHTATELRVLDQQNNWSKIILPDGRQGWVRIDTIEEV
jgi:tetratricopeptide (TPR) repeat protein